MLAAIEDLLDSWPGTLLVVSQDRYFLERITDQQYAVMGGRLRHLPGGIDEYLRLRASGQDAAPAASSSAPTSAATAPAGLSGAELRAAEKELSSLERRIEKLQQQAATARGELADLDQSDYALLGAEMAKISALDDDRGALVGALRPAGLTPAKDPVPAGGRPRRRWAMRVRAGRRCEESCRRDRGRSPRPPPRRVFQS